MLYHISVDSDQFGSVSLHHVDVVKVYAEESEDEDRDINKYQGWEKESRKEEEKEHGCDDEDPNQPVVVRDQA